MLKVVLFVLMWPGLAVAVNYTVFADTQVYLPQDYSAKKFASTVKAQSELVIKGTNHDTEPRIVIMRFDDNQSHDYHSRLNIERLVKPGPFTIHLPLFGLKTPAKRLLNWQKWHRFILFSDSESKKISVKQVAITQAANFSSASTGYDLGSPSSPVLRGMKQITPKFAGLKGKYLKARHHASGNALTSDGIEGIKSLDIAVPNGRWQVTLWFAMEGEWENLPRQQNQHIQLQGKTVWQRNLSPMQWLKHDYLAGQYQEAFIDGTPWQLFGDKPEHRVTTTAVVDDGQLHVTFEGHTTHDNYLSGIFISPASMHGRDTTLLLAAIQKRFEQKWQVVNTPATNAVAHEKSVKIEPVQFGRQWQPDLLPVKQTKPVMATPHGIAVLDFAISSAQPIDNVELRLDLSVPAEIRQGIWRYQRPQGSSTLLQLSADELQTIYTGQRLRIPATLSRRINLVIPIPADFKGDSLNGLIALKKDKMTLASRQFEVKILNIKLPPVYQSIGIYHEKSPHWQWFAPLNKNANATLECDYRYLKKLGLTALSPPLNTPNRHSATMMAAYIEDLKTYYRYFNGPVIDYTTVKRTSPKLMAALTKTLKEQLLPLPQFAVADEVAPLTAARLNAFSAAIGQLRQAMPEASLVGQLNKPDNRQLVKMLDTVLINEGFGVSKKIIRQLQRKGKSVWLYNMSNMRMAAGFYLWQSKAQGYLQWHGRMPTAAPFNPLDGREADFQLIYPALQACLKTPDINAGLLAIAAGITDRRWLNWLTEKANIEVDAKQLLADLSKQVPTLWADVEKLPNHQIHLWRSAITDLAQKLHLKGAGSHVKH